MALTQKYKQTQRQVRVHTNESNYLKGMYFSDVPLVEGYSRVLVNFDIDSLSGALRPRKGLQSLGLVKPATQARPFLHNTSGFNTIVASKICAATDGTDPRKTNRKLQAALYNTDTRGLHILTCAPEVVTDEKFTAIPFTLNSDEEFVSPEPYVIETPGIHNKNCTHNNFFKKPVGTFAFGNQYYTFLKRSYYTTEKITDLPNAEYVDLDGNMIEDYATLRNNSIYGNGTWEGISEGHYFKFVSGNSAGVLAYYDTDLIMKPWYRSEEALEAEKFPDPNAHYILCYSKLGADIQDDEVLLDESISHAALDPDTYYTCQIIPRVYNPTEAASWGYNMLLDDPYTFTCTTGANIAVLGILTYDKDNKIALTPRKNQQVTLKGYYRYISSSTATVRVLWEKRNPTSSNWDIIKDEESVVLAGTPCIAETTLDAEDTIVRLTILDPDGVDSTAIGTDNYKGQRVLAVNSQGITAVSEELANTLNLEAKNYTLGQGTGMCEWEQRLVVWGVPGALNTLFISDVNNPAFFPYPNNIDIFTDPIISVHNYGNELLVLTASALYRLTWDTEGTGWTHKLVQQNLHVTEADTYMSCVIKNMFFFKSGEYYYMMVPKANSSSSVRGEVTIAPISQPIEKLLDNFHEEVYNLIKVMVNQDSMTDFTDHLVNYFSYVDSTKVVVTYVYDLDASVHNFESVTSSEYLYVQLIYDTDTRAWTMKAFEAPHMLYASHADAIQQDRFIDITPTQTEDKLAMQYYKFVNFADATVQYVNTEDEVVYLEADLKNYQYLDTGNREINTEMKKRFREFQFKLKNKTNTNLGFYTAFLVDGSLRRDLQRYSPRYLLDPVTNEPVIVVERVLDPESLVYNVTFVTRVERFIIPPRMLQDAGELTPTILSDPSAEDVDEWILNQSAFPGRTLWKVRMPITGKGLTPRAILLSTNQADYELLGDSWVYRTMNAR